ncbi:MAG: arginine--tRNA ligase [Acholeplasmatales bacterium]|nr:arginine--tRNA ligase [Acholeplasmatales bacterium]
MIDDIKLEIKSKLEEYLGNYYNTKLSVTVEEPKNPAMGDIAIPTFTIFKTVGKPMPEVVALVKQFILDNFDTVKEVNPTGPFVNVVLDKEKVAKQILADSVNNPNYGASNIGTGKTIVLDYSSPNIAKAFSVGHLRSTMIGNSLKLILQKCGYNTVAINYLGDWGTQFGMMIVAIEKWGNLEEIKKDPINVLGQLYVRINALAKEDEAVAEQAREAFRKIELGDEKYVNMWKWIREESLKESQQIYDLLNVNFDSYNGEAFYNDKMQPVIDILEEKKLLKEDQGAQIVDLGEDVPPALIKRSDGGSLYITRDLAAVLWREQEYKPSKLLYVVGGEQKLHFVQLKAVLEKMGLPYANDIEHVNFGLVLKDGKKMSTRKGNVVKLYDILMQAIDAARAQIEEKNPNLPNKEEVATKVGVGAVVFNDLKNFRALDYEFDVNQMVKFEGQTGPYLQYTSVRINSILSQAEYDLNNIDTTLFLKSHYFELAKEIADFKKYVVKASEEFAPSTVAKYLLGLAQTFNKFYSQERINASEELVRNTNMALAYSVKKVIDEGLRLLGISSVEKM